MNAARDFLKTYWGHTRFRPGQEKIIRSVISGKDTLAVIATGGGKSICYQIPALLADGLTVVVSPLLSLMKDQADDLNARGIPAASWSGAPGNRERAEIRTGLCDGSIRLLFVSPERCTMPDFAEMLGTLPVRLIAIDEAHCISEWGHDFRPEYRRLSFLKKKFPKVPVIALTASAAPEVRRDIREQLGLVSPKEFIGSFDRKNLSYRVVPGKNPRIRLLNALVRHRDEPGIIYCGSRKETEELAADLRKRGYDAEAYHAGLPRRVRDTVQDRFLGGGLTIVCATIAFGMGINKPDVRYVIHMTLPKSPEAYYQETGRAGRDGRPAECILFYSPSDAARIRGLLSAGIPHERRLRAAREKLDAMIGFCETRSCRRRYLLSYFGEEYPKESCGSCDTCESREKTDGSSTGLMSFTGTYSSGARPRYLPVRS